MRAVPFIAFNAAAGIFVAATFLLSSPPLRAQEVQFDVNGIACVPDPLVVCSGPILPFTASFDLNTSRGQLSPIFVNFGTGVDCLGTLEGSNLAITNFSAAVGGHTLHSPKSSSA